MAAYLHHVPGRLRVRTPLIKGNQAVAQEVEDILRRMNGITSTTVNIITGSVIINYDAKVVGSKKILEKLKQAGYFNPSEANTREQHIPDAASQMGWMIAKLILSAFIELVFEDVPLIAFLI